MKALPIELRERIVASVKEGSSTIAVAKRFKVSWTSVKRFVKQDKEEGHLRHKKPSGRPRQLKPEHHALMRQKLKENPDWTIPRYTDWFVNETGIKVSESSIQRLLVELNLTRKKDLSNS